MKNFICVAMLFLAVFFIQACSGVRSASDPSGPITPSAGSAADIASGHNTTAAPVSGSDATGVVDTAHVRINGSTDSISNKLDSASKKAEPATIH